jgi:hypothetical protein
MAHYRPQASFTDSYEEIFPSRMVFITKLDPQVSLSPVPFFGVNTSYGLASKAPSSPHTGNNRTGDPYAATLEAAPGRAQDAP